MKENGWKTVQPVLCTPKQGSAPQLSPGAAGSCWDLACQAEEAAWLLKWSYLYLSMDLSSGHALPAIQFLGIFVGSQQAVLGMRKLHQGVQSTPMVYFNIQMYLLMEIAVAVPGQH